MEAERRPRNRCDPPRWATSSRSLCWRTMACGSGGRGERCSPRVAPARLPLLLRLAVLPPRNPPPPCPLPPPGMLPPWVLPPGLLPLCMRCKGAGTARAELGDTRFRESPGPETRRSGLAPALSDVPVDARSRFGRREGRPARVTVIGWSSSPPASSRPASSSSSEVADAERRPCDACHLRRWRSLCAASRSRQLL